MISNSAPICADLDLKISLRSTVRMNESAPIGADLDMITSLTRAIRIKSIWCLFINCNCNHDMSLILIAFF